MNLLTNGANTLQFRCRPVAAADSWRSDDRRRLPMMGGATRILLDAGIGVRLVARHRTSTGL